MRLSLVPSFADELHFCFADTSLNSSCVQVYSHIRESTEHRPASILLAAADIFYVSLCEPMTVPESSFLVLSGDGPGKYRGK